LDNVDRTVRFAYRNRVFDITTIYQGNPEWRWEARVSELDATGQRVIDGPGMLDYGQNPRTAISGAVEQILNAIDEDAPVPSSN